MFEPKVISVIIHHDLRGNGKENNPYRRIKEYCDFDGNILAEETDEFLAAQKSAELAATGKRTGATVAQPTEQSTPCLCTKSGLDSEKRMVWRIDKDCPVHNEMYK